MSDNKQTNDDGLNLLFPNVARMKTMYDKLTGDDFDEIDDINKTAVEDFDACDAPKDVSVTSVFNMLRLNTQILTQVFQTLGEISIQLRTTFGDTDKDVVFPGGPTHAIASEEEDEQETKEDKE
ncbi:hypothetical protein [Bifidobacterium apri]|uniref:Uncharacterized protein n=1 Tax=Bifidobacterium apri TaxID=1769423 RepID=A0A6A2VVV5_9BIFI|nr:hypothetical protein [Bifidobacterium apri]KAB8290645.1 hypothetical protein DSM100238_1858 [Bifidobacterium apri]